MSSLSRRLALKLIGIGSTWLGWSPTGRAAENDHESQPERQDAWEQTHDRVWLGGQFWANPMEDWRVVDGAAECQTGGGDRNIHLITHQLTDAQGPFAMSARFRRVEVLKQDGGAGFRIGIRSDLNESRSNCFARGGVIAGLVDGQLRLGPAKEQVDRAGEVDEFRLHLSGRPEGDRYRLTLTATDASGNPLATATHRVPAARVLGNVAVVNNFNRRLGKQQGARYRIDDWRVGGDAFTVDPERTFGPILWSMYSLSDSRSDEGFVLKISALTGPLGEQDNSQVELRVEKDGQWQSLGEAALDPDAWTATFRIPNWDESAETPYQLVYREKHRDGSESESSWSGKIKANPNGRPLRLGTLTCQNDYAFPYAPVAENIVRLDPDLLYFSGDQIYESHGGYGIIREPAEPAILNYLRKFYQFGWAFREAMRDRPTLCIPDDHDVFQGNIWGEAGAPMEEGSTSSKGGYREPARMVNAVHRSCAGHHPDPYDPDPVQQGISVYYGEVVYGDVGFAVIADRQFKSGPERVDTGGGRADHVQDPNFDTAALDRPGLELLGERQEEFLRHWTGDWRGHAMKVVLSQTVFAGVATHHGRYDGFLKADLDSGGWPQTPRDRAVKILRDAMPLHINGDQHLTTLCQYGVDAQRDSSWSFCPPAIAVGYPRWWRPDEVGIPHEHRPKHGRDHTGEYIDGFGNKVYVYAVGNPETATKKNRYERAHQKGSGFGMVTIDPEAKTYHIESFRFLVDATDGKASNQYPGWPVTIEQQENRGDNVIG